jgi:hypothetical protein
MLIIKHEGRDYVLKTFKVMCLKCRELCVTSNPYPDTAQCICGHVRLDGGISMGATLNGNPWAMEEYSVYRTEDTPQLELPREIITQHHDRIRKNMIDSYRKHGLSQKELDEIMSGR